MESCSLVISHILAEFRPERATYKTLHNQFSEMDYPNLLKLVLLSLKNCFLLTQSTLLFGETSPLTLVQKRVYMWIRIYFPNTYSNVFFSYNHDSAYEYAIWMFTTNHKIFIPHVFNTITVIFSYQQGLILCTTKSKCELKVTILDADTHE